MTHQNRAALRRLAQMQARDRRRQLRDLSDPDNPARKAAGTATRSAAAAGMAGSLLLPGTPAFAQQPDQAMDNTAQIEEPPAAEPEPVVEEPVVEEPVVEEPVAEEPVAEEPVAEEPVAEEPVVEEPVAEEPVAEKPVVEEPVVEELIPGFGQVAGDAMADPTMPAVAASPDADPNDKEQRRAERAERREERRNDREERREQRQDVIDAEVDTAAAQDAEADQPVGGEPMDDAPPTATAAPTPEAATTPTPEVATTPPAPAPQPPDDIEAPVIDDDTSTTAGPVALDTPGSEPVSSAAPITDAPPTAIRPAADPVATEPVVTDAPAAAPVTAAPTPDPVVTDAPAAAPVTAAPTRDPVVEKSDRPVPADRPAVTPDNLILITPGVADPVVAPGMAQAAADPAVEPVGNADTAVDPTIAALPAEIRATAAGAAEVTPERIAQWHRTITTVTDAMASNDADAMKAVAARYVALDDLAEAPTLGWSYEVQTGDSLWAIAEQLWAQGFPGVGDLDATWRMIYAFNGAQLGDDPDLIDVGQVVQIPVDVDMLQFIDEGSTTT